MLYLIPSKIILTVYLESPQIVKADDYSVIRKALYPSDFDYPAPYNADFLISYSDLESLPERDTNQTKQHIHWNLEYRIKQIGNYGKKNIDVFILEESDEDFKKVRSKIVRIATKNNIRIDCSTLSVNRILRLGGSFDEYYSRKVNRSAQENLLKEFFRIKENYNPHKIPNMNRLTANGLSRFDDWFENGYVSYRHVSEFARNDLNLPAGGSDERLFYSLFGYLPSENCRFSDEAFECIKNIVEESNMSSHKIAMLLEYYKGNKLEWQKNFGYKPPYEYLLLGSRRNIDRKFLIYLCLVSGASKEDIEELFTKSSCVLTDFLKEDILLNYFAENDYLIDVKQRGSLFRYLWESI